VQRVELAGPSRANKAPKWPLVSGDLASSCGSPCAALSAALSAGLVGGDLHAKGTNWRPLEATGWP